MNYIFFSSLSLLFALASVSYCKLLYSNEYCPTDFLSHSLCPLCGYLSLSSAASSSMAWCIAVHILYRLCVVVVVVVVIVVRDVKVGDGEERERERAKSKVYYSTQMYAFVLFLIITLFFFSFEFFVTQTLVNGLDKYIGTMPF